MNYYKKFGNYVYKSEATETHELFEEKNRVSRNFHGNALNLTYGRTHCDINQPGMSISFLSLKEDVI